MATNVLNQIAIHATAETSMPTLPASSGSNISQADFSTAGFDTIAGANLRSSDYNANNTAISLFTIEEEYAEIKPPIGIGADDLVLTGATIPEIEFEAYDISEGLLTMASNISVSSNIASLAGSYTFRTVAFEFHHTALFVVPKAKVAITAIETGFVDGQVAVARFSIKPMNVSGYDGGFYLEWY